MNRLLPGMAALLLPALLSAQTARVPNLLKADPVEKAEGLFGTKDYGQALEVASSALEGKLTAPQQKRAYWLVGKSHEGMGRLDQALSNYQIAVRIFPRDADLLQALGDLFARVGLSDRAEAQYREALKSEPQNARANAALGQTLVREGLFAMAIPHFKAALAREPDDPEATLGLGRALTAEGHLEEAERTLRQGLRSKGGVETRVGLAEVQKRRGQIGEAIESLLAAAREAPERSDLRLRGASWLLGAGRVEEAVVLLQERLKAEPADTLARYLLGMAELRRGRGAAAVQHIRAAAEQDQQPFLREAAQATLESLR